MIFANLTLICHQKYDSFDQTFVNQKAQKNQFRSIFQLLFARGDLVELLISSNISRYAEFRAVDRVITCVNSEMKVVPCSRADVFTNKNVTVLEKRLLMKVLSNCMNVDNEEEFKGLISPKISTSTIRLSFFYQSEFHAFTFRLCRQKFS